MSTEKQEIIRMFADCFVRQWCDAASLTGVLLSWKWSASSSLSWPPIFRPLRVWCMGAYSVPAGRCPVYTCVYYQMVTVTVAIERRRSNAIHSLLCTSGSIVGWLLVEQFICGMSQQLLRFIRPAWCEPQLSVSVNDWHIAHSTDT